LKIISYICNELIFIQTKPKQKKIMRKGVIAMLIAFSFAVASCGGAKEGEAVEVEATEVEATEEVVEVEATEEVVEVEATEEAAEVAQ
jgi:predicted small secreted protein